MQHPTIKFVGRVQKYIQMVLEYTASILNCIMNCRSFWLFKVHRYIIKLSRYIIISMNVEKSKRPIIWREYNLRQTYWSTECFLSYNIFIHITQAWSSQRGIIYHSQIFILHNNMNSQVEGNVLTSLICNHQYVHLSSPTRLAYANCNHLNQSS